ncbi:MAG: alpha/beta hydrolase family protein, partial [bacterium]
SHSNDIAFIILLAEPGKWGPEFFRSQAIAMAKATGCGEYEFGRIRELYEQLIPIWTKGNISRSEEQEGYKILEKLWQYEDSDSRKILGNTDAAAFLSFMQSEHIREFLEYDPAATLRNVKCPVLAIIGDKDVQVPSSENPTAIDSALHAGGNKYYNIVELRDLNHLFQKCGTGLVSEYPTIRESISPVVLDTIADWFRAAGIIHTGSEGTRK